MNRVLPIVLSSVVTVLLVGCSSGSDGATVTVVADDGATDQATTTVDVSS